MSSPRDTCVIVGAGPTAAATATALLARGEHVTVVDAGFTLEDDLVAARRRLSRSTPDAWNPSDLAVVRPTPTRVGNIADKQLFGSDFTFRDDGIVPMDIDPRVGARSSFAVGGMSNIWGAGVSAYTDADMAGWPIGPDDLEAPYASVLELMPYAARDDALASQLPLLREPDGPLIPNEGGRQLLDRLQRHQDGLKKRGIVFGASRLAVRTGHPAPRAGCIYCGRCLEGCPYGHIYNAADTFATLRRHPAFEYRGNQHVDRVIEDGDRVVVEATALHDHSGTRIDAKRAFLAAGSVSTTIILQASGLLAKRVERLLDSQTLYVPIAWTGRGRPRAHDEENTLAQVFFVMNNSSIAPHSIHVSLYSYNESIRERAHRFYPRVASAIGPQFDSTIRRIITGIGFFHSDDSHKISCTWNATDNSARLEPVVNHDANEVIKRFQRNLFRAFLPAGLVTLACLVERATIGGGYHYGGSVPMRTAPAFGESDVFGRPFPASRVHVVDSSCFASIPAGPILVPAMANAYRIATRTAEELG